MITVEIWSDIVCPWCYIGKRRFEQALAAVPDEGVDEGVNVVWRSFQLDPDSPAQDERGVLESLAERRGLAVGQVRSMFDHVTEVAAGVGLKYDFDRVRSGNTFDAHRLLHFAAAHGRQGELKERLMHAHFIEGEPVGDPAVLARLAAEVGLDEGQARAALDEGAYTEAVGADLDTARALGVTGVPFFVFDRKFAVSGAQPVEVFARAFEVAREAAAGGAGDESAGPDGP
jgi:predicted DsbA family dithiol-disulfide isomerase